MRVGKDDVMVQAKYSMKDVLELANQIKDKRLREKTIVLLKKPEMKNPEFVYPAAPFEKIPAWVVGAHHHYEGGELDHTVSIAKIALVLAENMEKAYGIKPNRDYIIAGALLHDIGKVFLMKKEGKEWAFTGCHMDHADLSAAIVYAHEFPEEVVHIIASHGGDQGAGNANPRTIEALLIYHADIIDAAIESNVHPQTSQLPFQVVLVQPTEKSEE